MTFPIARAQWPAALLWALLALVVVDGAAVIAARYGHGRVVVSSPHPEGDNSLSPTDRLCIEVTRWILEGTR